MGTFERSYEIGGETFELYAQRDDDGGVSYQLVDEENLPIGRRFGVVPDELTVRRLVRAIKALDDPAA